jgi:hypothetical protein
MHAPSGALSVCIMSRRAPSAISTSSSNTAIARSPLARRSRQH